MPLSRNAAVPLSRNAREAVELLAATDEDGPRRLAVERLVARSR